MRALDLFCKAGGAAMGLHRAGFEVTGIDVASQPNYPFRFFQGDATQLGLDELMAFDFIWASPPCQAFTAYKRRPEHVRERPNHIPRIQAMLRASRRPYCIENVPGAPLKDPFALCGSMFGLDVRRHRLFETSFPVSVPPCQHARQEPRFPPATNRKNLRRTVEVGVWRIPLETQRQAMGIDWMTLEELSEAVPPAYSEFIAHSWLASLAKEPWMPGGEGHAGIDKNGPRAQVDRSPTGRDCASGLDAKRESAVTRSGMRPTLTTVSPPGFDPIAQGAT